MSQYFDNDKSIKSDKRLIEFDFDNRMFNVYSDNGVFSKDRFDYGTRVLLENIDINGLNGNVLDLGCGIGVVGIILGTINKNIVIDMVDINERAVSLAKENVDFNRVNCNVFVSDVYSEVNKKYNYIITNPPIRAGKEVVRKFLIGAINYLSNSGVLYFVMRKDHGVKSMIRELEEIYLVEVIDRSKGFYIVKCSRKQKYVVGNNYIKFYFFYFLLFILAKKVMKI